MVILKLNLLKNEEEKMKNLWKQIGSFLTGIVVCILLSLLLTYFLNQQMEKQEVQKTGIIISDIIVFLTVLYYVGWCGIVNIKPIHTGVLLILDNVTSWYLLPSGYSWLLPKPLMDFIDVNMKELTIDTPIQKVLTRDNVEIEIDIQTQLRIIKPLTFINVETGLKAIEALIERNARWLARVFTVEKIGDSKDFFAQTIAGKTTTEEIEKELKKLAKKLGKDYPKETGDIIENWGIELVKVMVTRIKIPDNVTKANEEREIKIVQKKAEKTAAKTLAMAMDIIKKKYPKLSDKDLANLAQTQSKKGTISRHIIDGNATPIEKAGLLAGGKGGEK